MTTIRTLLIAIPVLAMTATASNAQSQSRDGAPYANSTPFPGASISANPHPRGSQAYCRTYARQTAANAYDAQVDRSEGFGSRFLTENSARRDGEDAYQRCLSRR